MTIGLSCPSSRSVHRHSHSACCCLIESPVVTSHPFRFPSACCSSIGNPAVTSHPSRLCLSFLILPSSFLIPFVMPFPNGSAPFCCNESRPKRTLLSRGPCRPPAIFHPPSAILALLAPPSPPTDGVASAALAVTAPSADPSAAYPPWRAIRSRCDAIRSISRRVSRGC